MILNYIVRPDKNKFVIIHLVGDLDNVSVLRKSKFN